MRLRGPAAAALVAAAACACTATARAQIAWGPCGDSNDFACGHLTVPLDPSGATPGTLTLAMRRHRAPVEDSGSAVVALAGGPGQEAIPFAEQFDRLLGPVVATRDLIVFDQRGTGLSQKLSCPPPKHPAPTMRVPGQGVVECADEIGPLRAHYTTPDSVADVEAIRRAGGYRKLVLYGTSYGTKVAEQYAEDYPDHVEALVLDSVVPPNGPDPLHRPTFAAVPRVLRGLCAYHECAHITRDPVADLARLVRRMGNGSVPGRVIDGYGRAHPVPIASDELLGILLEGDFNPLLRAEFIPAARSAAHGDMAALARLLVHAASGGGEDASIDVPLYLATTCEEEAFSWNRAATPQARLAQATAQIRAQSASVFAPFTRANAFAFSDIRACAFWPFATAAPPVDDAPLPDVPALILSGAADLRTPTSSAQEVAAQIPDAHLLVVPYGGHSTIGNEPTSCGRDALQALFSGRPIKACPATAPPPIMKLPPLPPPRIADVPSMKGYGGLPGRTLHAVTLTLEDFVRQFLWQLLEGLSSGSLFRSQSLSLRGGGLRAGYFRFDSSALLFHDYSYVPDVTISGRVAAKRIVLHVGGSAAASGTLRLGPHKALVGTLGGRHVHIANRPRTPGTLARARPVPGSTLDVRTARLLAPLRRTLDGLPSGPVELDELPYLLSSRLEAQARPPSPLP
jgi:pimeloyl-ACP methyl ester carboxylesterase